MTNYRLKAINGLALMAIIQFIASAETHEMILDGSKSTPSIEVNEKGYWVNTYSNIEANRYIQFGMFTVTHIIHGFGGSDVGDGMSYWDGFTYCSSGDTTDYGQMGSSDGWVPEQWGCMAGGGILSVTEQGEAIVKKGAPYLVGYWGYWIEEKQGGEPACQILINDGNLYSARGIWVCNHPWPYYGNLHGDGFARPFTEPDDEFALYIHGLDAEGNKTGQSVKHVLADVVDGQVRQSAEWQWVDLTSLGNIGGVYFTQTSTDYDPTYGMNTACYFCVDRLTVADIEDANRPSRPIGLSLEATETEIVCHWDPSAEEDISYRVYLDGKFVQAVDKPECTLTDLKPWTTYSVEVRAVNGEEIESDGRKETIRTADTTAPLAPTNLTVTNVTRYSADLQWDEASDNVGIKGYEIYLNDRKVSRSNPTTAYSLRGLDPQTEYTVRVVGIDLAGNKGPEAVVEFTTPANPDDDSSIQEVCNSEPGMIVYDLNGRKIVNPKSGIYIYHGRKIIIK